MQEGLKGNGEGAIHSCDKLLLMPPGPFLSPMLHIKKHPTGKTHTVVFTCEAAASFLTVDRFGILQRVMN